MVGRISLDRRSSAGRVTRLVRWTLGGAMLVLVGATAAFSQVPPARAASVPANWATEAERVVADARQHLGQGPYGYSDGGWYVPQSGAKLPGNDRSGSPPSPDREPVQLMRAAGTYLPAGIIPGIDCVGFMYVVFTETGHGNYAGADKVVSHRMNAPGWFAYFAANATNGTAPTLEGVDFDTSVENAASPSIVSDEGLEPGDIVFFKDDDGLPADPALPSQIFHVAIYEGPYARHATGQSAGDPWVIGATGNDYNIDEGDLNYQLVDPNGGFGVLAAVVHLHLDERPPLSNTIPPAPYASWSGSDVTPVFDSSTKSTYVPLAEPTRVLDTRIGLGAVSLALADVPLTFRVTGAVIPSNAVAVTGSLTVVNDPNGGAVYLGPVPMAKPGEVPTTSSIDLTPGQTVTNGVTVGLGSAGNGIPAGRTLSATYVGPFGSTVDLILDVTGYFVADASGGTYHPIASSRVLDTRATATECPTCDGLYGRARANSPYKIAVAGFGGVPEDAAAITGNLTVVGATGGWALYVGPYSASPPKVADLTTAVTVSRGTIASAGITVGLTDGALTAEYLGSRGSSTDLVLDVTGYFTADAGGAIYVPLVPVRLLDTPLSGPDPTTFEVTGETIPTGAVAVTGDAVVDQPSSGGSVAIGQALSGPGPTSSGPGDPAVITLAAGESRANQLTAAVAVRGTLTVDFQSEAPATAHFVLDVTGYFAPARSYDSTTFHPVAPERVLDTRSASQPCAGQTTGKLSADVPYAVKVAGCAGVPPEATAVTGNVTVWSSETAGFLYAGPDPSTTPTTSVVNFPAGQTVTNGITVALRSGTVSATYVSSAGAALDLAFDVTGYFSPDSSGSTYHTVAPTRVVDSTKGIRLGLDSSLAADVPAEFEVAGVASILAGATAVTGNVTVSNAMTAGSLYLGPARSSDPTAVAVSVSPGRAVSGSVTVALSPSGELWATYLADGLSAANSGAAKSAAESTTDIAFDVTGYFTADASGSYFVPLDPVRVVDSRFGLGLPQRRLAPNRPVDVDLTAEAGLPGSASAIAANVTVVKPSGAGSVHVGPDAPATGGSAAPSVSAAIAFGDAETLAEGVTTGVDSGRLAIACIASADDSLRTDVVVDLSGYYVPNRPPGSVAEFVATGVPAAWPQAIPSR